MKTITIQCEIQFDLYGKDNLGEIAKVVDNINIALQKSGLECDPQIMPGTCKLIMKEKKN